MANSGGKAYEEYFSEIGNDAIDEEPNNPFMTAYRLTGLSKIDGVCEFVETLVDNGAKFLVFAHHLCMIEALESFA
jgi:hypothetical protein